MLDNVNTFVGLMITCRLAVFHIEYSKWHYRTPAFPRMLRGLCMESDSSLLRRQSSLLISSLYQILLPNFLHRSSRLQSPKVTSCFCFKIIISWTLFYVPTVSSVPWIKTGKFHEILSVSGRCSVIAPNCYCTISLISWGHFFTPICLSSWLLFKRFKNVQR